MDGAINRLKSKAGKEKAHRYKDVPEYAVPKPAYSDKSANGLTKCVLDWINFHPGCMAYRVNNTGIYDAKAKKYRTSNTRRGIADISAIIHGKAWQIEIKAGKDKMSEFQKSFKADVEKAGGIYLTVRSFRAFLAWWDFYTSDDEDLPRPEE